MKIKLLNKGYKQNDQFYKDFLNDKLLLTDEYFSEKSVHIESAPDFPIYMGKGSEEEKKENFIKAFETLSSGYLTTDRNIHFDELFWHSLLVTEKRDFILQNYPSVKDDISEFRTIVIKKFDWENYIYKCIVGAQYVNDFVQDVTLRRKYYELIHDNLDVYNYIIKYSIFRNNDFLIKVLDIVDELKLSEILKSKIKNRPDLGKDERVGRRVIYELNKSYPVIMSPMMDKAEFKEVFLKFLGYYYDTSKLI